MFIHIIHVHTYHTYHTCSSCLSIYPSKLLIVMFDRESKVLVSSFSATALVVAFWLFGSKMIKSHGNLELLGTYKRYHNS